MSPTATARSRYSALDNAAVAGTFVSMLPWQDALDRHLHVMKHTHRMIGTASETVGAKPARAGGGAEHQVPRAGGLRRQPCLRGSRDGRRLGTQRRS